MNYMSKHTAFLKYFYWLPSSIISLVLTWTLESIFLGKMTDALGQVPTYVAVSTAFLYTIPVWTILTIIFTMFLVFIFYKEKKVTQKLFLTIINLLISIPCTFLLLFLAIIISSFIFP